MTMRSDSPPVPLELGVAPLGAPEGVVPEPVPELPEGGTVEGGGPPEDIVRAVRVRLKESVQVRAKINESK